MCKKGHKPQRCGLCPFPHTMLAPRSDRKETFNQFQLAQMAILLQYTIMFLLGRNEH